MHSNVNCGWLYVLRFHGTIINRKSKIAIREHFVLAQSKLVKHKYWMNGFKPWPVEMQRLTFFLPVFFSPPSGFLYHNRLVSDLFLVCITERCFHFSTLHSLLFLVSWPHTLHLTVLQLTGKIQISAQSSCHRTKNATLTCVFHINWLINLVSFHANFPISLLILRCHRYVVHFNFCVSKKRKSKIESKKEEKKNT